MTKKLKFFIPALLLIFAIIYILPFPTAGEPANPGFVLLSPGKDGAIGTDDDIYTTAKGETVKGAIPADWQLTELVPSAFGMVKENEKQPLQTEVPEGWIGIYTVDDLVKIGKDQNYPLSGSYILMASLDLSSYSEGEGWEPIGNYDAVGESFNGIFDGNGLVIKNLKINRPQNYQGLFGRLDRAEIRNLQLENVDINGNANIGGLAGRANVSTIRNCCSIGNVSGTQHVGGLVGSTYIYTIEYCYSAGSVSGGQSVGGLVGQTYTFTNSKVSNCYSTASVNASYYYSNAGGLIGYNNGSNCTVSTSYSTGSVNGRQRTGGLVGYNDSGAVINSYWDMETSGRTTSAGGIGKTTAEMKQQATYNNWDFNDVWGIEEDVSYPYLISNKQTPLPQ